jgi:hypothetical protein
MLMVLMLSACAPAQRMEDAGAVVDAGEHMEADASVMETTRERPTSLETSCWKFEAWCDPRNEGCGALQCSLSQGIARPTFSCHAAGLAGLGTACESAGCAQGLHCRDARCERLCCESSACPALGEACVPIDEGWGTLGTCRLPPPCAPAGGACVRASQCCSGDCDVDHCH